MSVVAILVPGSSKAIYQCQAPEKYLSTTLNLSPILQVQFNHFVNIILQFHPRATKPISNSFVCTPLKSLQMSRKLYNTLCLEHLEANSVST